MPAAHIFSDVHREFIRVRYLSQGLQPAIITTQLNEKFDTSYTLVQVQRLINARWSKLRKTRAQKGIALGRKTDAQLTSKLTGALMQGFAERSVRGANKAFDMVDRATDARTMASATSAAKTMVSLTRICLGLEGVGGGGPRAATFNFNFANVPFAAAGAQAAQADITPEVQVTDVSDEDDEGADADDDGSSEPSAREPATPQPIAAGEQPVTPAS